MPKKICEFKLKAAKLLYDLPKKPNKCRNFLKFGPSCLSFLTAALRVAKEFFRFWTTSEPQLLAAWLRIKNRVLENFFRVVLFHDTRSSDSWSMHKFSFFTYHEWTAARGNSLDRVKVPMLAHQLLPLTGYIFEASYSTSANQIGFDSFLLH